MAERQKKEDRTAADIPGLCSVLSPAGALIQLLEYKGFLYQAASWKTARRVVAKVERHPGELSPQVGFSVTNLTLPSRAAVRFYNNRGTAQQCLEYHMKIRHFLFSRYPEGVGPAPLWAVESFGMERMKNGPKRRRLSVCWLATWKAMELLAF